MPQFWQPAGNAGAGRQVILACAANALGTGAQPLRTRRPGRPRVGVVGELAERPSTAKARQSPAARQRTQARSDGAVSRSSSSSTAARSFWTLDVREHGRHALLAPPRPHPPGQACCSPADRVPRASRSAPYAHRRTHGPGRPRISCSGSRFSERALSLSYSVIIFQ